MTNKIRQAVNLLRGRRLVRNDSVDFDKTLSILKSAASIGACNFDVLADLGRGVRKRKNDDISNVISTIEGFFVPGEKYIDGEWVNRIEFEGNREIYRGKKEDIHYLDLKTTLFGGQYRHVDGGKKPHPYHSITVKYEVPNTNQD